MSGKAARGALFAGACLGLAACGAPAAPLKTAAAPGAAQKVAAPVVAAPLAPVVTPAEPPAMAALARRLAMVIDGAKPQVTPFSIDVSALPSATILPNLETKEAVKLDRTKLTEDPNLTVKPADGYARQYMLSFAFKDPTKVTFAHVKVKGTYGVNEGWFGDGYGGSVNTYMTCGAAGDLVPLRWETVQLGKDEVTYTVSDGVLDRQTCRVLSVRHAVAKAKPLLPRGILYGFRSCGTTCSESEELTVLFPRAAASAAGSLGGEAERSSGSFSVVSFPIQRGGGGAFVARVMRRDVVAWQVRADDTKGTESPTPLLDDAARVGALFLTSFELGVEVSQAHDDSAPIALAYIDIDPASLPPPPAPAAPKASAPVTLPRLGFNTGDPLSDRR